MQDKAKRRVYSFRHDCTTRQNPKLQRLIMRHGAEGLGIYWAIVEMLHTEGGRLEREDTDVIAFWLCTDKDTVEEVIFASKLFGFDDRFFWSEQFPPTFIQDEDDDDQDEEGDQPHAQASTERASQDEGNSPSHTSIAKTLSDTAREIATSAREIVTETRAIAQEIIQQAKAIAGEIIQEARNDKQVRIRGDDHNTAPEVKVYEFAERKVKGWSFRPPQAEEVKDYVTALGLGVDAERFVDFYECKGWMVGSNKMRDWKAAVRTWSRREAECMAHTKHAYPNRPQAPQRAPQRQELTNRQNLINDEWK